LNRRKYQNIGVHLYQKLMSNSRDVDQIEFERDAQFYFFAGKGTRNLMSSGRGGQRQLQQRSTSALSEASAMYCVDLAGKSSLATVFG